MIDYAKLNEILVGEYTDVVSYVGLYKETENPIFRDIAREEMIHAKHIENILKDAEQLVDCEEIKKQAKAALEEV